jgi:hypothetical protein
VVSGSVAVAKSQPPTPGERIRLGLVERIFAGGLFEAFPIPHEIRVPMNELKSKSRSVE